MVQRVLDKSIAKILTEGDEILDVVTIYVCYGKQAGTCTLMHADPVTQHKIRASCIEKNIRGICKRTGASTDINHAENKVRQDIVIKRAPSHASRNTTVRQREL